jgi:hypothetical protein
VQRLSSGVAAAELGISSAELAATLPDLDPRLASLAEERTRSTPRKIMSDYHILPRSRGRVELPSTKSQELFAAMSRSRGRLRLVHERADQGCASKEQRR